MRILLCTLLLSVSPSLRAQTTMTRSAELLAAPRGPAIGTLRSGAAVAPGTSRAGFTQVTVEGYVSASALGAVSRSRTTARAGARLRATPSAGAAVIADLRAGTALTRIAKRGDWIR